MATRAKITDPTEATERTLRSGAVHGILGGLEGGILGTLSAGLIGAAVAVLNPIGLIATVAGAVGASYLGGGLQTASMILAFAPAAIGAAAGATTGLAIGGGLGLGLGGIKGAMKARGKIREQEEQYEASKASGKEAVQLAYAQGRTKGTHEGYLQGSCEVKQFVETQVLPVVAGQEYTRGYNEGAQETAEAFRKEMEKKHPKAPSDGKKQDGTLFAGAKAEEKKETPDACCTAHSVTPSAQCAAVAAS